MSSPPPASVALARQYRPRQFQAMVGQEHVTQALGNALATGRLHHAYLFTGTRGVGKTTVSRILAKALNCTGADGQGGVTTEPCGVCPSCRDIDAGRFVDYIELDAASNRGVDEISQLLDQAVYKPVVGRTKVYMIDEVHMLSTHAFNAMLKTLEEPPEYLKFVLATTDPQKVPVTVLSRCLQFNLRPLPPPLVAQHLDAVLNQERVPFDAAALRLLARAARGSMRDALSLTDQAIAFGAGKIHEAQVQQMLGATPRAHVLNLLDALVAADAGAVVFEVDALRAAGHAAQGAADELVRWLQLIALAQAAPQALDPQDPDRDEALRLAPLWAADELQLAYRISLQAREELPLSPDEHAGLLMLLLRVLAFKPAGGSAPAPRSAAPKEAPLRRPSPPSVAVPVPVPLPMHVAEPVAAKAPSAASPPCVAPAPAAAAVADEAPPWLDLPVEEADAAPAPANEPVVTAKVPAAVAEPALQETPEGEAWALLLPQLQVLGLARSLALQAQCLRLDRDAGGWTVQLRAVSGALAQGQPKLQAALEQHAGVAVHLGFETGPVTDSPSLREQAALDAAQLAAQAALEASPELASIRQHFPTTRVQNGSVKPLPT